MDIISRIELSMIERLKTGLGRMVTEVASYAGELDDLTDTTIRRFPAAWVTFGGVTGSTTVDTRRGKFKDTGRFAVMVGTRNVRSEVATRHGGPGSREIGAYTLVYAVRRLLIAQDLGLEIEAFKPGPVRTLYNSQLGHQAFAVFACEFSCAWISEGVEAGHWPCPEIREDENGKPQVVPGDPDEVFVQHGGKTELPPPVLEGISLNYFLEGNEGKKPDASDDLKLDY